MSESDETAFLAAIRAAPDDDLPRLVYADWLSENGDRRGEFKLLSATELAEIPWIHCGPTTRRPEASAPVSPYWLRRPRA